MKDPKKLLTLLLIVIAALAIIFAYMENRSAVEARAQLFTIMEEREMMREEAERMKQIAQERAAEALRAQNKAELEKEAADMARIAAEDLQQELKKCRGK